MIETRIYANENYPQPIVDHLRQVGIDVLTSHDAGNSNKKVPDNEVLQFAVSEHRAVLTHNRSDFIKLHGQNPHHYGIIVCKVDHDIVKQAWLITKALESYGSIENKLLRINKVNYIIGNHDGEEEGKENRPG